MYRSMYGGIGGYASPKATKATAPGNYASYKSPLNMNMYRSTFVP